MTRIVGLVIGLSLTLAFACGVRLGEFFGSRPAQHYFISLPSGDLLCAVGKMHTTGWVTTICSRLDGFAPTQEPPPIVPSLPHTIPSTG